MKIRITFVLLAAIFLLTINSDAYCKREGSTAIADVTVTRKEKPPKITNLKFGSITINGKVYEKDMVLTSDSIRVRKKGPSKPLKSKYNHTPLTPQEAIPWNCDTLVVGIGMSGMLPVVKEFKKEAAERNVTLILLKTREAVDYYLKHYGPNVNAILHITC